MLFETCTKTEAESSTGVSGVGVFPGPGFRE